MSTWTEWDGREFAVIASSRDHESLVRLVPRIAARLWPGASQAEQAVRSCEDVRVSMSHDSTLSVMKEKWDEMTEPERLSIASYVE